MHFYPQKLRFIQLIQNLEWPLWDPYLHGGQPFLADPNNVALYPSNLIYLALPGLFAFNLDIVLHVLLCAAAVYWLCRFLGLSPVASMLGGAVYAFSGYTLSLVNLMNRLYAMPYLPLMLLTWQAFKATSKSKWFIACAVLGAIQVMAGAPEMTALTLMTLIGWGFCFKGTEPFKKTLIRFGVLILFITGLSAIQILPTAEMLSQSTRSGGSDFRSFSAWSLNFKRLPELIFPGFLGPTDAITRQDFWGAALEDMGFPYILSIYCGFLTFFVAFNAFRRDNSSPDIPTSVKLFLLVVIILSFVLSFGRFLPGFELLFRYGGILTFVRYPIKFLVTAILPLSMLAAIGVDSLFRVQEPERKAPILLLWAASAILTGLYFLLPAWSISFQKATFDYSSEAAKNGIQLAILHSTLFVLAATFAYQLWIAKRRPALKTLFAGIVIVDLLVAGSAVNPLAPGEFFSAEPALAKTVRDHLGEGRFYRAWNPPGITVKLPRNDLALFNRWNLETLTNYLAPLYSIPVIYHEDYDDLAQKELTKLSDHMNRRPWNERLPALTAGGVSLILTADSLPDVKPVLVVNNSSDRQFYLYRNQAVSTRAFFVTGAVPYTTLEEGLKQLCNPQFNPKRTVLIQNGNRSISNSGCPGEIVQEIKSTRETHYRVRTECDGYLYLAEPFYDGWVTEVDGIDSKAVRANLAFTAVPLTKGTHYIERRYEPTSVRWGALVSIISLIALFVVSPLLCSRL